MTTLQKVTTKLPNGVTVSEFYLDSGTYAGGREVALTDAIKNKIAKMELGIPDKFSLLIEVSTDEPIFCHSKPTPLPWLYEPYYLLRRFLHAVPSTTVETMLMAAPSIDYSEIKTDGYERIKLCADFDSYVMVSGINPNPDYAEQVAEYNAGLKLYNKAKAWVAANS